MAACLAGCIATPAPRNANARLDKDLKNLPKMALPANVNDDRPDLIQARYDFKAWVQAHKLPKHAVIMTMSGGGTRAAALARSVLLALDSHRFTEKDGTVRSLADNVILVSAVSGGSMTASAFTLHGLDGADGIKSDAFKNKVLKSSLLNVLLYRSVLNPFSWSDRAAPFEKHLEAASLSRNGSAAIFKDLVTGPNAQKAPFLILNSTDIVTGAGVTFTQQSMADICTDLSKMKLSSAVAAASNFPFISTDIELKNHRVDGKPCPLDLSADLPASDPYEDLTLTREGRYRRAMQDVGTAANDPRTEIDWLHLYDGGLAGNLGLRPVLRLLDRDTLAALRARGIEDIALVVVNARSDPPDPLNRKDGSAVFVTALVVKTSYGPIDRITAVDATLLQDNFALLYQNWSASPGRKGDAPSPLYPVLIDFDQLTDKETRLSVKKIETQDALTDGPGGTLQLVETVGHDLLEENPCFKAFLSKTSGAAGNPPECAFVQGEMSKPGSIPKMYPP